MSSTNYIVVETFTTSGMRQMPKLLTIAGMAISTIIFLLFLLDLVGHFLLKAIAPFQGASPLMDVVFVVCAGTLAFLSWSTFRELQ